MGGKQAKAHIFTRPEDDSSDTESEVSSNKSEMSDGDEFVTPDTEREYSRGDACHPPPPYPP